MTVKEIREFYENKKDLPCPITEKFIKAGYQQERGGYISFAHEQEVTVDYSTAEPTQWWHLIKSYCDRTDPKKFFSKNIKCGELYIWMAEVSGALEKSELENLTKEALAMTKKVNRRNKKLSPLKISAESNKKIRDCCFDRIIEKIMTSS